MGRMLRIALVLARDRFRGRARQAMLTGCWAEGADQGCPGIASQTRLQQAR